jgi:beta-galactosidase beta subunit
MIPVMGYHYEDIYSNLMIFDTKKEENVIARSFHNYVEIDYLASGVFD